MLFVSGDTPVESSEEWSVDICYIALEWLDPESEYDQIIRTASFFYGTDFLTALAYAAIFCMLTQPPGSAVAIHGGGRIVKKGHQRYYETELINLHWIFYGSSAPETIEYAERVNRLHATVWKRYPGTFSTPWEGQMSVIAASYFETWLRKTVGARRKDAHPKVQAAYPAWGERLTGHIVTEPSDGTRPMGINYPRTWDEMSKFFEWFNDFPFDEQATPEQMLQGHQIAEAFIGQFCELWFPRPLKIIGRHVLLTFVPPSCRRRQRLGEPNLIISAATKFILKMMIDLQDAFMPDPVEPPMEAFRAMLMEKDLRVIDRETKQERSQQDRIFFMFCTLIVGVVAILISAKFLAS